jgi:hypothetical protein
MYRIISKSEYRRLISQAPERVYAHIEALEAQLKVYEEGFFGREAGRLAIECNELKAEIVRLTNIVNGTIKGANSGHLDGD